MITVCSGVHILRDSAAVRSRGCRTFAPVHMSTGAEGRREAFGGISPALLITVGALTAIGPFSIDMYLPAFGAIATDLDTSMARVGLTLTTFFAGIAVGQLLHGPLMDRYGRKPPLMVGLVVFILACVACAYAGNVDQLIAARALMALGGCAGMVASRAVVRDVVPPHMTARIFSMLMLVTGVAPMVAPTIGGWVAAHFGWRAIFLLLAVIGVLMLMAAAFYLRRVRGADPSVSLHPRAVLRTWRAVFMDGHFIRHALTGSFGMAIMFAYIAGSPVVLMTHYGFSEQAYGWLFGLNAAALVLGSQVNAFVLRRRTAAFMLRWATTAALAVTLIMWTLVLLWPPMPAAVYCALLWSVLFCMGFVPPNATALALMPFQKEAGSASALLGALQMAVGVLASAAVSMLPVRSSLAMSGVMAACAVIAVCTLRARSRR